MGMWWIGKKSRRLLSCIIINNATNTIKLLSWRNSATGPAGKNTWKTFRRFLMAKSRFYIVDIDIYKLLPGFESFSLMSFFGKMPWGPLKSHVLQRGLPKNNPTRPCYTPTKFRCNWLTSILPNFLGIISRNPKTCDISRMRWETWVSASKVLFFASWSISISSVVFEIPEEIDCVYQAIGTFSSRNVLKNALLTFHITTMT